MMKTYFIIFIHHSQPKLAIYHLSKVASRLEVTQNNWQRWRSSKWIVNWKIEWYIFNQFDKLDWHFIWNCETENQFDWHLSFTLQEAIFVTFSCRLQQAIFVTSSYWQVFGCQLAGPLACESVDVEDWSKETFESDESDSVSLIKHCCLDLIHFIHCKSFRASCASL